MVGMLILTIGAVAAAVGLLLQHAAATQADAFHSATSSAISSPNHALLIGTIWLWTGTITTTAGVVILVLTLRKRRR